MEHIILEDYKDIGYIIPPDFDELNKIVCVQPHYDDNEIGAGGFIIKASKEKKRITYITITNGELGVSDKFSTIIDKKKVRKLEQMKNLDLLEIKKHYDLNYKDQGAYSIRTLEHELIGLFRKIKPDLVVTNDPYLRYESHSDHIKTSKAVLQAVLNCGVARYPNNVDNNNHVIKAVMLYYTDMPNILVDVSKYYDLKKKLILNHKSQFTKTSFKPIEKYLDCQATSYGKKIGVKYAEGFRLLPLAALHCISYNFLKD